MKARDNSTDYFVIRSTGFFLAAILSFTFDSTDIATRSIVAVGAFVVTGLLLWSICTGKLMIMNKFWLPLMNTVAFESVVDAGVYTAQAVREAKRAVGQKLRYYYLRSFDSSNY